MNKKTYILLFFTGVIIFLKLLYLPANFFDTQNYSKIIYDRNGEILRIYLNKEEQFILPMNTPQNIPQKLKEAVIFYEDKNFYKHYGVDPKAIIRAFIGNLKSKRITSGASTIPMQTIKIFRGGKRTYLNKIIEIIYAIQMEFRYDKDEILNIYLSHNPYGGNIIGYQSACLRYFNKIPQKLTWSEATLLAVIPNAPYLMNPKHSKELLEKRNKLLKELFESGKIDKENYELSLLEEIPKRPFPLPQDAILFTDFVKNNTSKDSVKSTLDFGIQKKVEDIISFHKKNLEQNGIHNTAVMVVDTKSAEILAYTCGDYKEENGGKIDALRVQRSSGSTLKPFLYALAFDKGIISKDSLLEDVPSYFSTYNPVNSDKNYRGLVSAEKALIMSLNVPIVKLLKEFGYRNFFNFIKESKIENLNNSDYYGLSMILGTISTSPYELAQLYTTLGNLGENKKLKFIKESKELIGKRLYSQGSAWLTLDIIKDVKRPEKNWEFFTGKNIFYWKTGTSFGERDAWSVGCNNNFVIVVWNGNLDNSSSSKLKGIESSAPIMFDILNSISQNEGIIEAPIDYLQKTNSNSNGYRSIYENTKEVFIPKGVILKQDPYERKIFTNLEETIEVDSRSFEGNNYKTIIINDYPSQVDYFLKLRGVETSRIKRLSENVYIHFIYPQEGIKIKIPQNKEGEYEKIMVEVADIGSETYYWYQNGSYITSTDQPKVFMNFNKGINRIDLITNTNHSASVTFKIE
jgi:penicillin-binding protein 1C